MFVLGPALGRAVVLLGVDVLRRLVLVRLLLARTGSAQPASISVLSRHN